MDGLKSKMALVKRFGLCCLMTPGLSKDIRCHVWPYFYKQVQISRSDIRPHIKWAVSLVILHMVTSIFLRALCGYIWVNILTLSPRGKDQNKRKNEQREAEVNNRFSGARGEKRRTKLKTEKGGKVERTAEIINKETAGLREYSQQNNKKKESKWKTHRKSVSWTSKKVDMKFIILSASCKQNKGRDSTILGMRWGTRRNSQKIQEKKKWEKKK